jgi:soluble lytic murein transglycosylase-like protein
MAVAPDTLLRTVPRLFERRVLFSPEYLTRVLTEAQRGVSLQQEAEALRLEEAEVAREYARRYNISENLALQIVRSAKEEGIDPELGFRLVRVESVFQPTARGPRGALGLTQLMPGTARAVDRSLSTEAQILDPETNLRTGFRYLRRMIERYNGDVRLGLLAYNRGEGTVDRALRSGVDPENGYSAKVLGTAENRYRGPGLFRD